MKATRRHDLKENVLAKDLGKAGEFLKANGHWVVGGLLGLIVLVAVVLYALDRREKSGQREWQDYFALASLVDAQRYGVSPESTNTPPVVRQRLRSLAGETSQEELAGWSLLAAGHSAYAQLTLMGPTVDPLLAEQLTREAADAFDSVLAAHADRPRLAAEALLGLGRLAETNYQFEQAQAAYERAADLAPQGAQVEAWQALRLLAGLKGPHGPQSFPSAPPEALPSTPPAEDAPAAAPADSAVPEMIRAPEAPADVPEPQP